MRHARIRTAAVALVVALAIAGVSAAGCQRKVEVKSGTRTVCTEGEVVSEDIKTVKVPAGNAGAYSVRTITVTCDKHSQLPTLYAEAQTALAAGNTALAATKLEQVLAIDSTYRKAKEQSDAIKKGGKPAPDTSAPPTTPTTGTVTPTKPGDETGANTALSKWTPEVITGFTPEKLLTDALSATRDYVPSGKSAATSLTLYAEQLRTAADAKSALKRKIKERYPKNAADFKVKGRDAYFGTDGKTHAVIGFTDGAVFVALELTTAKSPNDLRSLAEQIVAQLP